MRATQHPPAHTHTLGHAEEEGERGDAKRLHLWPGVWGQHLGSKDKRVRSPKPASAYLEFEISLGYMKA